MWTHEDERKEESYHNKTTNNNFNKKVHITQQQCGAANYDRLYSY